jgi:predicted oxidoreductase (fatty acid repression mutant protein)
VEYESLASIKEKFAIYADKFDPFALESNAMSQYLGKFPFILTDVEIKIAPNMNMSLTIESTVWLALESEGFGANLQHYSPLIDEQIAKTWDLPASWKLDAQLVFGVPTSEPGEKTFEPLENRFKVFGK